MSKEEDNKTVADRWFVEFRDRIADRFPELMLLALLQ
jgi:hypothetical protein